MTDFIVKKYMITMRLVVAFIANYAIFILILYYMKKKTDFSAMHSRICISCMLLSTTYKTIKDLKSNSFRERKIYFEKENLNYENNLSLFLNLRPFCYR